MPGIDYNWTVADNQNETPPEGVPGYFPATDADTATTIRRQAATIQTLQAETKILRDHVETLTVKLDRLAAKLTETTARLAESESRRIAEENASRGTIRRLETRIAELEAQTGRNSKNSSQPPSADGPAKPNPTSLRPRNTGRKSGGQPGHRGATLLQTDRPDQTVVCHPDTCHGCGADLAEVPARSFQRRQVLDLPPLELVCTEYRIDRVVCPGCRRATDGAAPPEATRQVQYGPGLLALAGYLHHCGVMSLARTQQFCRDVFGCTVSQQVIVDAAAKAAAALDQTFKPAAKQALAASGLIHADETGFRIDGRLAWLHSASNPDWTWIEPHQKRGLEAIKDIAVLTVFAGVLVHDCWAAYDAQELVGIVYHQLCCSHILREFNAVTEYWAAQGKDQESDFIWSVQAADALRKIIHDPTTLDANRPRLLHAAMTAVNRDLFPAGKLGQKHRALALRVENRIDDYLYFATHAGVPATNNPAEQEIRVAKIRQKVSGGMRTLDGAKQFATIRSYISTARKHGITAYQAIRSLFTPAPWLPATAAAP